VTRFGFVSLLLFVNWEGTGTLGRGFWGIRFCGGGIVCFWEKKEG
jgi:hypothetical protein